MNLLMQLEASSSHFPKAQLWTLYEGLSLSLLNLWEISCITITPITLLGLAIPFVGPRTNTNEGLLSKNHQQLLTRGLSDTACLAADGHVATNPSLGLSHPRRASFNIPLEYSLDFILHAHFFLSSLPYAHSDFAMPACY